MESKTSTVLSVTLKTDWDIPVNLPLPGESSRGHFAGRTSELASLTNEIIRRTNGAILVAGHRGVGKTSLVHKAIIDAQAKDLKVLPILINAAQLDLPPQTGISVGERTIDPKALIEQIIRRLFATVRSLKSGTNAAATPLAEQTGSNNKAPEFDVPTYRRIEALYRKTVAQEFKLTESLSVRVAASQERSRTESIEQSVNLERLIYTLATALSILSAYFSPSRLGWLSNLIPLLVFGAAAYTGKAVIKSVSTGQTSVAEGTTAEELYQFDNRLGNLEYDLETIQRDLKNSGWKLVYVIDELDKLPVEKTKSILSMCKNFFTLSDAVFIFIGDDKAYDIGQPKDEKRADPYERAPEYTYFTSRYFLAPPTTSELAGFFNDVIASKTVDDVTFRSFGNCLFFEAHNDYFDLLSAIRGRISSFKNNLPVIELGANGLSVEDVQKSRFEMCLNALYEDKYMARSPLKWRDNKELIGALFLQAKELLSDFSPRIIAEPQLQNVKATTAAIVRDFYQLLQRQGSLTNAQGHPTYQSNRGVGKAYHYIGSIPYDPPLKLLGRTEYENVFLKNANEFLARILAIYNIWAMAVGRSKVGLLDFLRDPNPIYDSWRGWQYDPSGQISQFRPLYDQLNGDPPYEKTREEVETMTKTVSSAYASLYPQLPMLFAKMIVEACEVRPQVTQQFQGQQFLLPNAKLMRETLTNERPHIVYAENRKRQVLLVCDLLEKLSSLLRDGIPDEIGVVCFTDSQEFSPNRESFWVVPYADVTEFERRGAKALTSVLTFLESNTGDDSARKMA
jgi:hypothetical protein